MWPTLAAALRRMGLQEERSKVLWRSLERVIPDIRQRAEVVQIGARDLMQVLC